jgi:hypothetical protein
MSESMMSYRCYLLDERDRIKSFIELQALSDAEAATQARHYAKLARRPFELWRGHELICREP